MSRYRLFAQAVGIFDLIISTILMLWVIVAAIFAGTVATVAKNIKLEDIIQQGSDTDHAVAAGLVNAAIWVLGVIVAVWAIITALQMWSAIRLLSATQIGRDSVEALRLASTWMTVSVVFLVLETIGLVAAEMYIEFGINLVLRGAMICIVALYMNELNKRTLPHQFQFQSPYKINHFISSS